MNEFFDGKKVRDEILKDLKIKVSGLKEKPFLRVFWVGDNEVSGRYVSLKKGVAEGLGVRCEIVHLSESTSEKELLVRIEEANKDSTVSGIMIQIPLPAQIDKERAVLTISENKDIDGLRICAGYNSDFQPPVVLAIVEAMTRSKKDMTLGAIVLIGQGFLVGKPLLNYLKNDLGLKNIIVADDKTPDLSALTKEADILISATGVGGIIKPDMVTEGVVLIDAGTSEAGGKFLGDIDPGCYEKASYYTPVPKGIGPVTIAMLMKNLVGSK